MAKEQFVIEELQGLDTNLVDGLGKFPDILKNLQFDRRGGYNLYGRPFQTTVSNTLVPLVASAGYALYRDDITTFQGSTVYLHPAFAATIDALSLSRAGISKVNSIPGAIYAYQKDNPGWVASGDPILAPAVYTYPNATLSLGSASGSLPTGNYKVAFFDFISTPLGAFITDVGEVSITLAGTAITVANSPAITRERAIYVSSAPPGTPTGFVGILPASTSASLTISAPADIDANSDVIFVGHHDVTAFHQSRCYVANPYETFYDWGGPGSDEADFYNTGVILPPTPAGYDLPPLGNRIYYSEVLTDSFKTLPTGLKQPFTAINMTKAFNYFDVPFTKSNRITALASSPAGLLIFSESEIFLFRGDPGSSPSLIRFSGTIGCDLGKEIATMGGVVFTIFNGEVYVISLGMGDIDFDGAIENISIPIVAKDSKIAKIAVSEQENYLTVRNDKFKTFVYDFFNKKWFESPNSPSDSASSVDNLEIINYAGANGVYYCRPPASGNTVFFQVRRNGHDWVNSVTARFGFRELDFGDKFSRKLFRSVEVYTSSRFVNKLGESGIVASGSTSTTIIDASGRKAWPANLLWGTSVNVQIGSASPEVRTVASNAGNSITFTAALSSTPTAGQTYRIYPTAASVNTMDYEIGTVSGTVTADTSVGSYGDSGRLVFTLPVNLVGLTGSFTFNLGLMSRDDVIEPPIIFNFVPLSRRRI